LPRSEDSAAETAKLRASAHFSSSTAWLREEPIRRRDGDDLERPANMSGVDHGCVTFS